MNNTISTKFGTAKVKDNGYYYISSAKEGNKNKYLHRLIFEDYYGVTILPFVQVHHIDRNKTNNDISNLKLLYPNQHISVHKQGENNPMFGKHHKLNSCVKISESYNDTGFFRVTKHRNTKYSQGFIWMYQYYENGKKQSLASVNLDKLMHKVLANGLDWIVLDEEKAMECGAL